MAIDYNAGINSIDVGAHDITYSGNEGPKSPEQKEMMAFDDTPVFEMRSLDLLLDEFREDNNGQNPHSIDDLRRFFYNKYGPEGIAQVEKAVQQAEQQAQMQEQREGIQMAGAADTMLQDEYDKYVFEMEEMGQQPMPLEQFRQQAVAGMATGGRVGFRRGGDTMQKEDTKRMSPGRSQAQFGHAGHGGKTETEAKAHQQRGIDTPDRGPGSDPNLGQTKVEAAGYQRQKAAEKEAAAQRIETKEMDVNEDGKVSWQEKINYKQRDWRAESAKKSLKKLMLHKMRGSPLSFPSILQGFKGPMSDEEFEKQYGVSYEEVMNMSPAHMQAILGQNTPGSKQAIKTQTQMDDLTRISEGLGRDDLHKQDVWENIFYGDKGPPQPGGGGDGQGIASTLPLWQQQGFNSYADWLAAQGTGTAQSAALGDIPDDRIRFAQNIDPSHHPILAEKYGFDKTPQGVTDFLNQYSMFAADGGRAGYAGGGDVRQEYFLGGLGKIFKKAAKKVKKLGKSKLGKLAMLAMLGKGTGMFGGGKGLAGLKKMIMGTPIRSMTSEGARNYTKGGLWNWIKKHPFESIAGVSALGGITADDDDDEGLPYDWEAKKARDAHWGPLFDESNFRRIYPADYADGGRIGYAGGGDKGPLFIDPESVETRATPLTDFESDLRWTDKEKRTEMYYDMLKLLHGMSDKEKKEFLHGGRFDQYFPSKERALEFTDDPVFEDYYEKGEHYNQGGRIGAQEGGLMDLGGMEKDYRQEGGFVPIGGQERADDVPARLSKNEFVFTADAVRAAGGGDIDAGAEVMENVMENLENGGNISEESQGLEGARDMFATSQRLEGVL